MKKIKNISLLLLCAVLPVFLGYASSLFSGNIKLFYQNLVLPALSPPSWVFGPVWGILYLLMGISFYLLLTTAAPAPQKKIALILFAAQFIINMIWSPVFFGAGSLWAAFGVILLLDISVIITFILFLKINKIAAFLLLPYLVWITFASYLNLGTAFLNF